MKTFIIPNLLSHDEKSICILVESPITKEEYDKFMNPELKNRIFNITKDMKIRKLLVGATGEDENAPYFCQIVIVFTKQIELHKANIEAEEKMLNFIKTVCNLEILENKSKEISEIEQKLKFCKEVVEGKNIFPVNDFFKELCACYICVNEPKK